LTSSWLLGSVVLIQLPIWAVSACRWLYILLIARPDTASICAFRALQRSLLALFFSTFPLPFASSSRIVVDAQKNVGDKKEDRRPCRSKGFSACIAGPALRGLSSLVYDDGFESLFS